MTIFGPKPWVSPLGKMAIFRIFELFSFYSVERRFFVLEYCERHFPFLNCLKNKKVGIMASLGPKPWVNPLEKISIFLLFELLFLQSRKAFFLFRISLKIFSLPKLLKKKKLEKWPFFDKNHGLTPLEKCQVLGFFDFQFLQRRKAFFCSRIS